MTSLYSPEVVKLLRHHTVHGVEDDLLVRAGHRDVLAGPGHGVGRDGVDHDLALVRIQSSGERQSIINDSSHCTVGKIWRSHLLIDCFGAEFGATIRTSDFVRRVYLHSLEELLTMTARTPTVRWSSLT